MAGNRKIYHLDIDGPQLRRQRELLFLLMEAAGESRTFELGPKQFEMLDGLVNLTDDIADQAHDRYGIDCLLTDDEEGEIQTVELGDGGCLEYETEDGTLRRRDQHGNTEDVRRPGDEGYDNLLALFQEKRRIGQDRVRCTEIATQGQVENGRFAASTLTVDVAYDPTKTDPESLAVVLDRLMETALCVVGILEEYGSPKIGKFVVTPEKST